MADSTRHSRNQSPKRQETLGQSPSQPSFHSARSDNLGSRDIGKHADKNTQSDQEHTEARIQALQHHHDVIRFRAEGFDRQRATLKSDKNPLRQTDQTVKEKLQLIGNQLKEYEENLGTLSSPKVNYALLRPLTTEEVSMIKDIDNHIDKKCKGPAVYYSRSKKLEDLLQDPNSAAIPKDLQRSFYHMVGIYPVLTAPVWNQLARLKAERETMREQLTGLREQRRILKDMANDAKKNLTPLDKLKLSIHISDKSKSPEVSSLSELREIQKKLSIINALIKKAHDHKSVLSEEIQKGHTYLLNESMSMKANSHLFFVVQQINEYRIRRGGKKLIAGTTIENCGITSMAMLISDIDPSYGDDNGRKKVYEKWKMEYKGEKTNQLPIRRYAEILNKLQDAITYKLSYLPHHSHSKLVLFSIVGKRRRPAPGSVAKSWRMGS